MGKATVKDAKVNANAKTSTRKRAGRLSARPRPRRARSSSSAASDLLETPPPPPTLPIALVEEEVEGGSPLALPSPAWTPKPEPPEPDDLPDTFDVLDFLPPAPPPGLRLGPVCESRTVRARSTSLTQCTSFYFAGHLDNRTQWQLLHQALVIYMYELNMSPQIAWHHHRMGQFRGTEQKYTVVNIVTGSSWTNVFEKDMENLIRKVWQGGDRHIEVYRTPHE
ncbi:unnamed protein product [Cutaneotrichosporon oleaginosum]